MAERSIDIWRRRLEFLRAEEAIASDVAQKFTLAEQIKEAKEKVRELEAECGAADICSTVDSVNYYLRRLAEETSCLTLIGMGRNLQIELPIADAYVPLRTTLARSMDERKTERFKAGHAEYRV